MTTRSLTIATVLATLAFSQGCNPTSKERRSPAAKEDREATTETAKDTDEERAKPSRPRAPAPSSASTVTPTAGTSTSPDADRAPDGAVKLQGVRIVEGSARETEAGFVIIPGELVNESDKWLEGAGIDVVLLDARGEPINVDSVAAADGRGEGVVVDREHIPPGGRGYFTYIRDKQKLARPYASHRLSVRGFIGDGRTRGEAESVSIELVDGVYEVKATIKNDGELGCRSPELVYGKFAKDGKLVESSSFDADEWFGKDLPPGQSVTVSGKVYDHDKIVSEVRVYANCNHPWDR